MSRRRASNSVLSAYETGVLTRLNYPGIGFPSVSLHFSLGPEQKGCSLRGANHASRVSLPDQETEPKVRIELTPRTYHVRALTS